MKVLITYSSKTGNTQQVAEAIKKGFTSNHAVDCIPIKEVKNLEEYEAVLLGFWVDKGSMNFEAKKFLGKIADIPLGLFGTIGANPDSEHGKECYGKVQKLVADRTKIINIFLCNGKVSPKLIKALQNFPKFMIPKSILEKIINAGLNSRPPNEQDFEQARKTFIPYFS